jgi:non-ribosomal peptide synthetase component F
MATNLKCTAGMKHMSIGYPEANMHCYIVDRFMQPVPVGVPGELLLSGPRLARGYIGRADLTADKFVPNPCYDDVAGLLPDPLRKYFQLAYRTGGLDSRARACPAVTDTHFCRKPAKCHLHML